MLKVVEPSPIEVTSEVNGEKGNPVRKTNVGQHEFPINLNYKIST